MIPLADFWLDDAPWIVAGWGGVFLFCVAFLIVWCRVQDAAERRRDEHRARRLVTVGYRTTTATADLRRRLDEDRQVAQLDALYELPDYTRRETA